MASTQCTNTDLVPDPADEIFRAASTVVHQNALDDGIGLDKDLDRYFPWLEDMRMYLLSEMTFNDTEPLAPPGPLSKCETRELFLASQNISRVVDYSEDLPCRKHAPGYESLPDICGPYADIQKDHVMYYADFDMIYEMPLLIQIAGGPVLDIVPEGFPGWCYRHSVCGLPPIESNLPYMNLPRVKNHKIFTHMKTVTKITWEINDGMWVMVSDPVITVDTFRIQGCEYPDYINSTYGRDIPKEIEKRAQEAMNRAVADANKRYAKPQEFEAFEDVYVRYWISERPKTYSVPGDYSGKDKGILVKYDAEVFATPVQRYANETKYNITWYPRTTFGHEIDAEISPPNDPSSWDTTFSKERDAFFLNGVKVSSTFMMGMMWGANITGKVDITDYVIMLDANMSRHMEYEQPFVGIPTTGVLDIIIDYGQVNMTCVSDYPNPPKKIETGYANGMVLFNVSNVVSHGYVKYNGDDRPGFRVVLTEIEKDNLDVNVIEPRFPLPRPAVNKLAAGAVVKMMRVWNAMFALHPILFPARAIRYLPNPTIELITQQNDPPQIDSTGKQPPGTCWKIPKSHGYLEIQAHCINHDTFYVNGTRSRWPACQRLDVPLNQFAAPTLLAAPIDNEVLGVEEDSSSDSRRLLASSDLAVVDPPIPGLGAFSVTFYQEAMCQLLQAPDLAFSTTLPVTGSVCRLMADPSSSLKTHPYYGSRGYAISSLRRLPDGSYDAMVNMSCIKNAETCEDCDFEMVSIKAGRCVSATKSEMQCGPGASNCRTAFFAPPEEPCLGPAVIPLNENLLDDLFVQMYDTSDCTVPLTTKPGSVVNMSYLGKKGSCRGRDNKYVGVFPAKYLSSSPLDENGFARSSVDAETAVAESEAASNAGPLYDVHLDCSKNTCDMSECFTLFTSVPLGACVTASVGSNVKSIKLTRIEDMLPGCSPQAGPSASSAIWAGVVGSSIAITILVVVLIVLVGGIKCLKKFWSTFQQEYWEDEVEMKYMSLDEGLNGASSGAPKSSCRLCSVLCGMLTKKFASTGDAIKSFFVTIFKSFGFRVLDPTERMQTYVMLLAGLCMIPNMITWISANPYNIYKSQTIGYVGLPLNRLNLKPLNDGWDWWSNTERAFGANCFVVILLCFIGRFILKAPVSYSFWRWFRVLAVGSMLAGNILFVVGPGFFTKFKELVQPANDFMPDPEDRESRDQFFSLLGNIYAAACTSYLANLVLFLFHSIPTAVCTSCSLLVLWAVNQSRMTPSLAARVRLAMVGIAMLTPMVILLGLVLQYHMLDANALWMCVFLVGLLLNLFGAHHMRYVMTSFQTGAHTTVRASLHVFLNAVVILGYFAAGCIYLFVVQSEFKFDLRFCMSLVLATFFQVFALLWFLLIEEKVEREVPISVKYQTVGQDSIFFPLKVDPNKTTGGDFEAIHVGTDRLEDKELDRRQEEINEQHYVSTTTASALTLWQVQAQQKKALEEAKSLNSTAPQATLLASEYQDTDWETETEKVTATSSSSTFKSLGPAGTMLSTLDAKADARVKNAFDDNDDIDENAGRTPYTGRCPLPFCDSLCIFLLAFKDFVWESKELANPIKYGFRVNNRRMFLLVGFVCSIYVQLHWLTTSLQTPLKEQLIRQFEDGGWGVDWKWPAEQDGGDFFDTAIATYENTSWFRFSAHMISISIMFCMLVIDVKGLGYKGLDNSRYLGYVAGSFALIGTLVPALPNYKSLLGTDGEGLQDIVAWCAPDFNHAADMIIGGTAGMFLAALFIAQLFGLMTTTPIAITRVGAKLLQTGAKFSGRQRRDWMPVHNVATLRFMLVFGNVITPMVLTIPLIFFYQSFGDNVTRALSIFFFIGPLFWSFFITKARSYSMLIVGYYSWLFSFLGTLFALAIYTAQREGKLQRLVDEIFKLERILGVVAEICISNVIVSDILLHVLVTDAKDKDGKIVPVNL